MLIGFTAAFGLLPAARGANDMSTFNQLNLFSDAFTTVRKDYVRPVQDSELINAAIEGMVSELDPHSSYMDPKAFADMQIQTKGEFGGVGIEVTMEDGLIKVISPIDDTPAAKAGIKSGDFIAAIDGTPIQGLELNDAIDKMRGPAGTKVTLTILRTGQKKPFDVTLARAIIKVNSAKWHREGDVGYIRLTGFNEQTASGLENAVRELKRRSARASRATSSTCATIRAACSTRRSRCRTTSSPRARSFPRAAAIPTTRSAMTPIPATSPTASRSSCWSMAARRRRRRSSPARCRTTNARPSSA